jgi:hypothetical protein
MLTARDLSMGLPGRFLDEYGVRQRLLESDELYVEIPAFTAKPLSLLPFFPVCRDSGYAAPELTHSPNHWANRAVADYYGKASVIGLPAPQTVGVARHIVFTQNDSQVVVDSYLINYMLYFRISDMENLNGNVNEIRLTVTNGEVLPAYLHSETSYMIRGEVFYREDIFKE